MLMVPQAISHEMKASATSLYDLMDSFDLDMLQLNVESCRSIINYLDDKRIATEQEDDETYGFKKRKHFIDVKQYEAAWLL